MNDVSILDEPTDNIKTFILIFMAIIWKRTLVTSIMYCEHNKLKMDAKIVLKCLKYNIYCPVGITNNLKPYIIKALNDGFLMPQFFKQNKYAERAVKMYKSAYEVVKQRSKKAEINFLKEYASKMYENSYDSSDQNQRVYDLKDEINDIINQDNNQDTNQDTNNNNNNGDYHDKGICSVCELIECWDLNINLMYFDSYFSSSDDNFRNIIMKGLMSALNDHVI